VPPVPPPPVIDSARVLAYALVDDIPYCKWGALYSGDKLIEHVPCLAICVNLGNDIGPLLFHCDDQWQVLGTSGAATVEAVKERAERNYPGVSSRWVEVNTSIEDALRYYDEETGGLKCSFCGRRPFDLKGWVEGSGAAICRECVDTYHQAFQESSSDGSDAG
jgi:ClpX C4-type zinc finger